MGLAVRIELALLDVLAREAHVSVEALLGLPETAGTFHYTAVVGVRAAHAIERYMALCFRDFKLELCGELEVDRASVDTLTAARVPAQRLRLDANNLWTSRADAPGRSRAPGLRVRPRSRNEAAMNQRHAERRSGESVARHTRTGKSSADTLFPGGACHVPSSIGAPRYMRSNHG